MSDSKKFLAPAAIAAALAAVLVPTEAHAKKVDCEVYKPERETSKTEEKSKELSANVTGAGGGGAAVSSATSSDIQELSDEEIAKANEVYRACQMYKDGLLEEAEWKAAKAKFLGIAPAAAPAAAPAGAAPAGTAPAAGGTAAPVVIVQPPPASPSTSTAPAQDAKGGGGGKGGLIVGIVAAVAVVVVVIATIAHFSDGSGKDDDATGGGDTGSAMIVSPDQASIAIV